jgi:hypothetical protein
VVLTGRRLPFLVEFDKESSTEKKANNAKPNPAPRKFQKSPDQRFLSSSELRGCWCLKSLPRRAFGILGIKVVPFPRLLTAKKGLLALKPGSQV